MAETPQIVDDLLALDDGALDAWLLRRLDEAPPNERGENFIHERLAEWFPATRAIGAIKLVDQFGLPRPDPSTPVETRLKAAYGRLRSHGWITRDNDGGKTFVKITETGREQLQASDTPPDT